MIQKKAEKNHFLPDYARKWIRNWKRNQNPGRAAVANRRRRIQIKAAADHAETDR
jgi:hypothetical protein